MLVKQSKMNINDMLLGTLSANLLQNLLLGKGVIRADEEVFQAGDGTTIAKQNF